MFAARTETCRQWNGLCALSTQKKPDSRPLQEALETHLRHRVTSPGLITRDEASGRTSIRLMALTWRARQNNIRGRRPSGIEPVITGCDGRRRRHPYHR